MLICHKLVFLVILYTKKEKNQSERYKKGRKKMEFYKKIRKLTQTATIILAGLFGIIGIVMIIAGFKGVLSQFTEAENIDEIVFGEMEEGTYVEGDLKLCLGSFASWVTETSTGSEIEDSVYYMFVIFGEGEYDIRYLPVEVPAKDKALVNEIITQTDNATDYEGYVDEEMLTKSYHFEGYLKEMSKDEQSCYDDAIEEMGVEEFDVELMVNADDSVTDKLAIFIIGVFFAVIGSIFLIIQYSPYSTKKVRAYVKAKNLEGKEDWLLADFNASKKIKGHVRMGKDYIYFANGFSSNMVAYEDIIWAYVDTLRTKNGTTYTLVLTAIDRSQNKLSFSSKAEVDEASNIIFSNNPGILVGKDEFKQLYKKNFDELIIRYKAKLGSLAESDEASIEDTSNEF